ncbi:putative UDP-glucuronate decarboxylase [Helianthus annuus]|nr:putative UDP-glucuronate decarboxylase [Helianthus annuus]KAJ0480784.1 putative UDP-glucuronate decarboxylase [Helianthus annuus]KAJ0670885.1 putative UDP-glucuronate decarboxylase [Helianthus annuus]KAJ0848820.1 putative UDP-glucuronate decarboxylase [Helianthus annuus]KAJ0857815.1 putative UDP-glucuronate decarboxylase [Helianthus annuus]
MLVLLSFQYVLKAIRKQPMTVYGDGNQTRSFQYVSDLTIDESTAIEFRENTADDPQKRKPDISKAKELLNWEPKVPLREGLPKTASDFRNHILNENEGIDRK